VSFEPFMWSTFCDDVRQEVGNKLSYLGIYGPNLIVPVFPTTLVKLCCVFNLRVPAERPPGSVVFKLLRDDEVIFEHELSVGKEILPTVPPNELDVQALTISSVAQLVGFPITQQVRLKSRAIVDGKELRGGALDLQAAGGPNSGESSAY
jgi:hypothetical protein